MAAIATNICRCAATIDDSDNKEVGPEAVSLFYSLTSALQTFELTFLLDRWLSGGI